MGGPRNSAGSAGLSIGSGTLSFVLLAVICSHQLVSSERGLESSLGSHHISFGPSFSFSETTKCPKACICSDFTVDCSHRGLSAVPRGIPMDTERLRFSKPDCLAVPIKCRSKKKESDPRGNPGSNPWRECDGEERRTSDRVGRLMGSG
ncbi:hypothetical protein GWI33_005599 [Rhynchophorus ferrugineus]|uniref:LRRNT domain-containing protein n=1 Tax=Rhynchophorus ferrugineus TaxID=354439 RepID=A0A834IMV9_RHYFE|nr:hypothetical protein GWI33_005599 [Rhynchophorus ferrugineus]